MKIETKAYASLGDIKALRLECRDCGAILTLPLHSATGKSLEKCPKCREGWTVADNTNYVEQVEAFVGAAKDLLPCLKAMGFDLSLEISFRS